MPRIRKPRPAADLEASTAPDLMDGDRRRDVQETPTETLTDTLDERGQAIPVGGGFTPAEDGGNPDHPIHDEDDEDLMPEDYEREIDSLDGPVDKVH